MTVERLDFSKPPPGYNLDIIDDEWWWGDEPEWLAGTSYLDRDAALAAAWAHHKARHDPPGMVVEKREHPTRSTLWRFDTHNSDHISWAEWACEAPARAAAWGWYESSLELSNMVDGRVGCVAWEWPRPLTMTAPQRAEAHRWLVDSTAEMPEVLRG